jgi:hypothetical protein
LVAWESRMALERPRHDDWEWDAAFREITAASQSR